jgi:hypothetical protein
MREIYFRYVDSSNQSSLAHKIRRDRNVAKKLRGAAKDNFPSAHKFVFITHFVEFLFFNIQKGFSVEPRRILRVSYTSFSGDYQIGGEFVV